MKKYVFLAIFLVAVIILVIPISYLVARGVVEDAVLHKLQFLDGSGTIQSGLTDVKFAGSFNFTNGAAIPLKIDRANITVYAIDVDHPYESNLYFIGSLHASPEYSIGRVMVENEWVPANGHLSIPVSFGVTSEDALRVIHGGNFSAGWDYSEITISGTYLFWHFTPQIAFQ